MDIYEQAVVEMDEEEYMQLSEKLRRWLEEESFFLLHDDLHIGIDSEDKHDLEFFDKVKWEIYEKGSLRLVVK